MLGGIWYGRGMLERPTPSYEVGSPTDGRRAQQKLFELTGKVGSPRRDPRRVTISEREINAFLTRHFSDELPLAEGAVHLVGNGIVELSGRLPLRGMLGDSVVGLARVFPDGWSRQPVWLRLRGPLRLETDTGRADLRRLRLDVESLWVGTRRVPVAALTALPEGPIRRATRWGVSGAVDSVLVEPGRLTVTSRP